MTSELKNKLAQMKPIDAAVEYLKETRLKLSTSQISFHMAQAGHGLTKFDWQMQLVKRWKEKDVEQEWKGQEVYWSINRAKYPTQTASQPEMFK